MSPLPLLAKQPFPTQAGYTFLGWFNGETLFDFANTTVTSALNLKAKWEIKSYTVTFYTDSGSTIDPVSVNHGQTVTEPAAPTKEGYTFKEWQLSGVKYTFSTPVTSSFELKAVWDEDEAPEYSDYVFDFSKTEKSDSSALSQTDFGKTIVSSNASEITAVFNTKVYGGTDSIKFGAGSGGGELKLTTTATIYSASIKIKSYASGDNQYVEINGQNQTITTNYVTYPIEFLSGVNSFEIKSTSSNKGRFYVASLTLSVNPPAPLASLSVSAADDLTEVVAGKTLQLSAQGVREDDTVDGFPSVTWSIATSDQQYLTVDQDGVLTGVNESSGPIVVTATSTEDETIYATISISVLPAPDGLTEYSFTDKASKSSSYSSWTYEATAADIAVNGGANNNAKWDYIRMGGKNLNNVDVSLSTTVASTHNVSTVEVVVAQLKSNSSLTINSFKIIVASNDGFSTIIKTVDATNLYTAAGTITVSLGETIPSGNYFRLVWNVKNTSGSNYGTDISGFNLIG